MGTVIKNGNPANGESQVTDGQVHVKTETNATDNFSKVGAVRMWSENDPGVLTGSAVGLPPETDHDFRLRIAQESLVYTERFNYAAQNTSKHTYQNTTMTAAWATTGLILNSGNSVASNVGALVQTRTEFEFYEKNVSYQAFIFSVSTALQTNQIIDFGAFRAGGANQYIPSDGVYFRLASDGLKAVYNYNGTESVQSPIASFIPVAGVFYYGIIATLGRRSQFWIDNNLLLEFTTPIGNGMPFLSSTLPISIRMANTGAVSLAQQFIIRSYGFSYGGTPLNRMAALTAGVNFGSYEGLSGGTIGQLMAGTVTSGTLVKPTAAVPANASLTANLPNNLAGRIWETPTGALNTDLILASYTNPAGTVSIKGKRLVIRGLYLSAVIQTVIVGGGCNAEFYIVSGTTADSLATTEAATTKAPRRVLCPPFTQTITAAQAVNTPVTQFGTYFDLGDAPIIVNPGERVQIVVNRFGTAITSGTIAYTYQFVFHQDL